MNEEVGVAEKRVRSLTSIYYSNPKVQKLMLEFAKDREVVPRYYEGFGKRPDMLQYNADIMGLVRKGATSFHASEELWNDPLRLSSEITTEEMNSLRKGWDLLIDIDSPFLDCSKIAAKLVIEALEEHGIKNYGLKFSGSKGFHLIVSNIAFPEEFGEEKRSESFPEWPRAICNYIITNIRPKYNREVGKIVSASEIEKRTNLKKADLEAVYCKKCDRKAAEGGVAKFVCPSCGVKIDRKDYKATKRKLRCINCPTFLELVDESKYYFCEYCKDPDDEKNSLNSSKYPEAFERIRGVPAEEIAALDLVLVAPRHLFRMPYSLHEKTSLASVVLTKEELTNFSPKDADPLKVKIREFMPQNVEGEARRLLAAAMDWRKTQKARDEEHEKKRYEGIKKTFVNEEITGVTDEMFPEPIKKLLKGMNEGRKRGLFVLITFLRAVNYDPEVIAKKVREWNAKNEPPLKEGYIRTQLDWHFRQKKKIMPPNYDNESFYKDLGLLDKKPEVKNPIVEVARKARQARGYQPQPNTTQES